MPDFDWIRPLFWPVAHILRAVSIMPSEQPPAPVVESGMFANVESHLSTFCGAIRSYCLAYVAIYLLWDESQYPAFGPGKELALSWIIPILLRNLTATWVICGFWDWWLYYSPLSPRFAKFKINPIMPTNKQILHDAFHTTSATLCGTALEVLMCYGWSNGLLPLHRADNHVLTLLAALTVTHWRLPHFYLIHRMMHPWKRSPDIGKFLYVHVHSLHHKSYNPTAFSGTSMHPVEATLYYSAGCMPLILGAHPIVALTCIVDCAVGAWIGHDGFHWPGGCDYFHQLHHTHFDGNYGGGAPFLPLDKFFGTFITCREDVKKNWGNAKVGRENNETALH